MEFIIGSFLEGKVSGIAKYGAFVSFDGGGSGLVHISEIANTYVNDVHDYLTVGDTVKVKVLSTTQEGKVNLSIKQALPKEDQVQRSTPRTAKRPEPSSQKKNSHYAPQNGEIHAPTSDAGFEEKLKLFMQDSDRKMSGNKLYAERKSNNRRRK